MALKPVTDPTIIEKLNLTPVTDASILGQLEPKKDKGFMERVGERFGERQLEVTDTLESLSNRLFGSKLSPEITQGLVGGSRTRDIRPDEAVVQLAGKGVAGPALDVLGEGLVSAGRGLSAITPDVIEEPIVNSIKSGLQFISGTDIGKQAMVAINEGTEAYDAFKTENPQAAKNIESIVNIGLLTAPVRVKQNAPPSPIAMQSAKLRRSAIRSQQKNRKGFIEDLVSPKKTPQVLLDEVSRTTEAGAGALRRSKIALSPAERAMSDEILRIPTISSRKTIQGNYNAISTRNRELANQLEKRLAGEKSVVPLDEMVGRMSSAIDDVVTKNPTVVGDPALAAKANRVAEKAIEILGNEPLTPLRILESRRALDNWLLKNRPKVFDQAENTLSASGRAIRNVMNQTIDDMAPGSAVRDSLSRQSTLFNVMENVAPKAAAEGNNALIRAWDNAARVVPVRNRLIQDAAILFGIGGLGAAAQFAPIITKGAFATAIAYTGTKAVMHPNTRKGIGLMLKAVDKAIVSSKNPSMIKQLRADRALIVELFQNSESDEDMPKMFEEQQ